MAAQDRPEPYKQYRLTGARGTKCIANGNSWAESRVDDPADIRHRGEVAAATGQWRLAPKSLSPADEKDWLAGYDEHILRMSR